MGLQTEYLFLVVVERVDCMVRRSSLLVVVDLTVDVDDDVVSI